MKTRRRRRRRRRREQTKNTSASSIDLNRYSGAASWSYRQQPKQVTPRNGHHVVQENIWVEVLLLDLEGASIAALMVIGLEIAKLETGRTNVIVVVKEVI